MTRIISHGRAEGEEDTGANKKKGLHRGEARERRFWGRRESATQRGNGRGDWLFVLAAKSLGARGDKAGNVRRSDEQPANSPSSVAQPL